MIRHLAFAALIAFAANSLAQPEESDPGRRYLNDVFPSVKFTGDIVFAKKINDFGNREEALKLRVFEPQGDRERSRPLLLITPGGGFVSSEETWMNEFAEKIATAGYVVALNNYRLSESIDTPGRYAIALAKAIADQKDAIAYLLDDAKNQNRFGIDPNKIFIGGHSAGAITSMHTAYLDKDDAVRPLIREKLLEHGVIADNKDPLNLSGVINLSGLLTDLSIIDRNDTPLLSLHGDKDAVINISGDENIFGSLAIHDYANLVGTESEMHAIRGAEHNDTSISHLCEECIPLIKRFMFNRLHAEK